MNVGLKYTLDIDLSKAKRDLDTFKQTVGKGLNAAVKKGGDAHGPFLPTVAQIRKGINDLQREAKRGGGVFFKNDFKDLRDLQGAAFDFLGKVEKKTKGKGGGKGKGVFFKEDFQDIRGLQGAAFSFLDAVEKKREKDAKKTDRNNKKSAADQKKADEESARRLDAINARRSRVGVSGGFTDPGLIQREAAKRAEMIQQLAALEANANTMGAESFREKLRQMDVAWRRFNRHLNAQQANIDNQAAVNNSGRNFQRGFQVQQGIEDAAIGYQLNGVQGALRGMSNNLSFLGASLGGNVGVIALVASLGLTLANTTGMFDRFTEASKKAKEELDNYFKSREHLLQLEERFLGRDQGDATSSGLTREVMEINQRTEARERELTVQEENLRLLRAYAEVQDQIRAFGFNQAGSAGVSQEDIKRYGGYLRERESISGQLGVNGVSVDADPDRVEEQTKTLRSELQGLAEDYEEAKAAQEEYTAAFAASNATFEAVREKAGGLSGKNDAIQSHLSDVQGGLGLIEEQRNNSPALARLREQANLFRPGGRDADPEQFQAVLQKIAELNDVFADQAEDLLKTEGQRIMLANELVEKADKARDQQEQSLAIVQQQAQAARQLAVEEDKRLETIKEQSRLRREQFEQTVFEAKNTIRSAKADEETKALSTQADRARRTVRDRAEQLRRQIPTGGRNSAQSGQARDWVAQQEEAYLRFIDEEEQRRGTGINSRRDADIQAATRAREGALSTRAGTLTGDAQAAFSSGQFDQARNLIEQSRSALQELTQLQTSQIGRGTSAEQEDALNRATQTQTQMDATDALEAQVTETARNRALNAFNDMVIKADEYEAELAAIKALQDEMEAPEWISALDVERAQGIRDALKEIANLSTRTATAGAVVEATGDVGVANELFAGALATKDIAPPPPGTVGQNQISNFTQNAVINNTGGSAAGVIAELTAQLEFQKIRAGR